MAYLNQTKKQNKQYHSNFLNLKKSTHFVFLHQFIKPWIHCASCRWKHSAQIIRKEDARGIIDSNLQICRVFSTLVVMSNPICLKYFNKGHMAFIEDCIFKKFSSENMCIYAHTKSKTA